MDPVRLKATDASGGSPSSEPRADLAPATAAEPDQPGGPRIVLVSGEGGAGRSTVAAATALAGARQKQRTLLLTAEPRAVLVAAFGEPAPTGSNPAEVAPGLWVARIDPVDSFSTQALQWQQHGTGLFGLLGAERFEAAELTEPPGAAQFALLSAVHQAYRQKASAGWDLVVLDAPVALETVRLVGLPEQLRRYLKRLLPPERRAARALHPLLGRLAGVPLPAAGLYDTADRWDQELSSVQRVLGARSTTVRLVVEPGPVALAKLALAGAGLALHGMVVDAVVANRLLPAAPADPWTAGLAGQQQAALERLLHPEPSASVTLCEVPHLGRDVQGLDDLGALVDRTTSTRLDGAGGALVRSTGDGLAEELRGRRGGAAVDPWTVRDRLAEEGLLEWRLPLPGALRTDLDLIRRGDELIVTVGPFRRALPLPSALRRCTIDGAGLADGVLTVRFVPDPTRWPKRAPTP